MTSLNSSFLLSPPVLFVDSVKPELNVTLGCLPKSEAIDGMRLPSGLDMAPQDCRTLGSSLHLSRPQFPKYKMRGLSVDPTVSHAGTA